MYVYCLVSSDVTSIIYLPTCMYKLLINSGRLPYHDNRVQIPLYLSPTSPPSRTPSCPIRRRTRSREACVRHSFILRQPSATSINDSLVRDEAVVLTERRRRSCSGGFVSWNWLKRRLRATLRKSRWDWCISSIESWERHSSSGIARWGWVARVRIVLGPEE